MLATGAGYGAKTGILRERGCDRICHFGGSGSILAKCGDALECAGRIIGCVIRRAWRP